MIETSILETERLRIRKMNMGDFKDIAEMLRDDRVMYAWEKTFTDAEITAWIQRRIDGYEKNGFDYFLAIDKQSGEAVGQIGLLLEEMNGQSCHGIGWILKADRWGKGYALEGAEGIRDWAFATLKMDQLVADIRPTNLSSIKVAERLGMTAHGSYIKLVDGKKMEHVIYTLHQ